MDEDLHSRLSLFISFISCIQKKATLKLFSTSFDYFSSCFSQVMESKKIFENQGQ